MSSEKTSHTTEGSAPLSVASHSITSIAPTQSLEDNNGLEKIFDTMFGSVDNNLVDVKQDTSIKVIDNKLVLNSKVQDLDINYNSSIEKRIMAFLDTQGIKYHREHQFQGCVHKAQLYIDFYLPELNAVIETDGPHHFIDKVSYNKHGDNQEKINITDLKVVNDRDKSKNDYLIKNKIHFLRISYNHVFHGTRKHKAKFSDHVERCLSLFLKCILQNTMINNDNKDNNTLKTIKWFVGEEYIELKYLNYLDPLLYFLQSSVDELLKISDRVLILIDNPEV